MSTLARGAVLVIAIAACDRSEAIPEPPELPFALKVIAREGGMARVDPCPWGSSHTHPERCPLGNHERNRLRSTVFKLRNDVLRKFHDEREWRMALLWRRRAAWAAVGFQLRSVQVVDDLSRNLRSPYRTTDAELRFDQRCFTRLASRPFIAEWERYVATLRTSCRDEPPGVVDQWPVVVERCPEDGDSIEGCNLTIDERMIRRIQLHQERKRALDRYRDESEHRKRVLWKRGDVGAVAALAMLDTELADRLALEAAHDVALDDLELRERQLHYEIIPDGFAQRLDEFLARYRSGGGTP